MVLAAELGVAERGAAHMGERRLPADYLGHEALDQRRVVAQLSYSSGILFSA
jgi:hypothetical protein